MRVEARSLAGSATLWQTGLSRGCSGLGSAHVRALSVVGPCAASRDQGWHGRHVLEEMSDPKMSPCASTGDLGRFEMPSPGLLSSPERGTPSICSGSDLPGSPRFVP